MLKTSSFCGVFSVELCHSYLPSSVRQYIQGIRGVDFREDLRIDQHVELKASGGAVLKEGGEALVLQEGHLHVQISGGFAEHLARRRDSRMEPGW